MAHKVVHTYSKKTPARRRKKVRPLNHRKSLGARSAFAGINKRRRGQG